MTEPIDTSKKWNELSEVEKKSVIDQCRKLSTAPSKAVEHLTPTASAQEKAEWLENYKKSLR
jgi:predicted Fe-S protein YdhL (DUF1289 family)